MLPYYSCVIYVCFTFLMDRSIKKEPNRTGFINFLTKFKIAKNFGKLLQFELNLEI
jgi:hypothetical protein